MKTIAMILAGGAGTRLTVLSEERAKPAVPFAGKFRIIDFTISNCVNSDIYTVGVLTQYQPQSLNTHIGIGKPWDLDRGTGGVRLLQPYEQRHGQHWYAGTADAIYQNMNFIKEQRADTAIILSGDHIYKMDYRPMLRFHEEQKADLTIGVMPVPIEEAHRFGIMKVNDEHRIVEFHEKPKDPSKGNLASMGIYIFNTDILEERLVDAKTGKSLADFGKDVIPAMLAAEDRIFAYQYSDYWVDVGTIDSYWSTNLALTAPKPELDLFTHDWPVHTKSEERPPAKLGPQAKVVSSMISNGCIIRGFVTNSVLSPGVYIGPGAVVKDSIVMNDCWIGPGAVLDKVIVDKEVTVGTGALVGTGDASVVNEKLPDKLTTGISVIGKGAYVPDRAKIGRNVLVNSGQDQEHFPADGVVADGQSV